MTGGQIALFTGAGLVALAVVYKIGKTQAIVPTTNPLGAPGSGGVNGVAPGSSTGTGTSGPRLTKTGQIGAQIISGSSSGSVGAIGKTVLATAVLGPSYQLYNAGKTFVGWL